MVDIGARARRAAYHLNMHDDLRLFRNIVRQITEIRGPISLKPQTSSCFGQLYFIFINKCPYVVCKIIADSHSNEFAAPFVDIPTYKLVSIWRYTVVRGHETAGYMHRVNNVHNRFSAQPINMLIFFLQRNIHNINITTRQHM